MIVDNQKFTPINRLSVLGIDPLERPTQEDPPFGVVDRVTISAEVKERYRQYLAQAETESDYFIPPVRLNPNPTGQQ